MPSAACYTNKVRFTSSVKKTKAQLPGRVANVTQPSISGCALNIDYSPIEYTENKKCFCLPLADSTGPTGIPPRFSIRVLPLSSSINQIFSSIIPLQYTPNTTYSVTWSPKIPRSTSRISQPSSRLPYISFKIYNLTRGTTYSITLTARNSAGSDSISGTFFFT